jgi:UDP-glucose 4-epimerase
MDSRRFLITGGAGFIGTHLAERLSARCHVTLLDNFRRDSLTALPQLREHPHVRVMRGDVLEPATLAAAMEGTDTVIHLAAIAGVSSYYEQSLRTLRVNLLGTVNVLDAAVHAGARTFLHFSTSETYGPDALFVSETSPHALGPVSDRRWVYATSKLAGEHFALRYGEEYGLRCTTIRPFNVYGPRQEGEGAISNFCRAAIASEPLVVYGDGSALRAWCYVTDLVDAVERVLTTEGAVGQAFNIGNPTEVETTLGLARRVARLSGSSIERRDVARAEVRARVPVIDKARELLGYVPQVTLDEGLERTLEWFRGKQAAS